MITHLSKFLVNRIVAPLISTLIHNNHFARKHVSFEQRLHGPTQFFWTALRHNYRADRGKLERFGTCLLYTSRCV